MHAVMADAAREAVGRQAVCVSHQLAIWVARKSAENRRLWHHPGNRQCALGSVTSFTYRDGAITGVSYAEPAGRGRSQVPGA
jgi:broad specificity phosphatase PhoE